MSKADSIQKKLWKAYGKVGSIMGKNKYEVYRSTSLDNPIQDANVIDSKVVAFSKDVKFTKPEDDGKSLWYCWIDGNLEGLFDIQKGDYLYSPDTGNTYLIASAGDQMYVQAFRANNEITITRAGYGDTGDGYSSGIETNVATSVPCYVQQPGSGGGTAGYIPAATYSTDALPGYDIFVVDPNEEIQIRDAVVDQNGNRSQVMSITVTDLGTKLMTRAYEP